MIDALKIKLERLETLHSEQEHTIQALNEVVVKQDREISRLNLRIEEIKVQLQFLKTELGDHTSALAEVPPHY